TINNEKSAVIKNRIIGILRIFTLNFRLHEFMESLLPIVGTTRGVSMTEQRCYNFLSSWNSFNPINPVYNSTCDR
ncbi:MAG: hypothetical protein Q4E32_04795, partial [Bacteroidales bacterium]|nr:hypothetical protein [Bacteroidales bacterium]